jgi:hypothetical protein
MPPSSLGIARILEVREGERRLSKVLLNGREYLTYNFNF